MDKIGYAFLLYFALSQMFWLRSLTYLHKRDSFFGGTAIAVAVEGGD